MMARREETTQATRCRTGSFALQAAIRRTLQAALAAAVASAAVASAAELPVTCVAGSCSPNVNWLGSGSATAIIAGNSLTVNQTSSRALFNWQTFNISADGSVTFKQPDAASVAVNRIFDANPSSIFGALNANGRVYLINQNGIVFKPGAKVNVGGLVASSLDIGEQALENGLIAGGAGIAAFSRFTDADGNPLPSGMVSIDPGAQLKTAEGGEILVFAPDVVNRGSISTPGGQTILAAGNSVFLTSGSDPANTLDPIRGLLVEVELGGTVTNGEAQNSTRNVGELVGNILAERGNVTLAGLAVNQLGRVSATTSVRANGTIRLQARQRGNSEQEPRPDDGRVLLGTNSVTDIALESSDETTVDANEQPQSDIRIHARETDLLSNSRIVAPGGNVMLVPTDAQFDVDNPGTNISGTPGEGRIYIADGALIDVSGATAQAPMERNSLRVELRGSQLADSPAQRDGALRGQTVFVDVRASGTRADGTHWQGSPIGDLSGDLSTIQRDVRERNSVGGSIVLASPGDVILAPGATLNVSGGAIQYQDGYVTVSQVRGADGALYDMAQANRDREYTGLASGHTATDRRWGVTQSYTGYGSTPARRFEAGYVEGKDAGEISIISPRAIIDGDLAANVVAGRHQRQPTTALNADQVFRSFEQVPLGGLLRLGNSQPADLDVPDYAVGNVSFESGMVLPGLKNDDGSPFDPLLDALPEAADRVRLRPELFGAQGVSRLQVFANETVSLPQDVALQFPAGGVAQMTAGRIAIDGDIDAPGGTIDLKARRTAVFLGTQEETAPNLAVGANSELSARGQWVNDNPLLNPQGATAPAWIDGGRINLSVTQAAAVQPAPTQMNLAPGSVLDVSAGAWRRADGTIEDGTGGSISVAAASLPASDAAVPFMLGAQLRGYGLVNGGSLSLTANEVCISALQCSDTAGLLWLTPEFFSQGGFANYQLGSNRGGVTVTPGTQVLLRQQNYRLAGDVSLMPSATSFADAVHATTLADHLRNPANLALTTRIDAPFNGHTATTFADAANLNIGVGAALIADPGARISLQSNSRVILDGLVRAPAGTVSVTLDNSLSLGGFLPSQGIWLGARSAIDVSGTARLVMDDLGRYTGEVLDGGSVEIDAQRGYLIASPGSSIDVSGTAAAVDVRASRTHYERRTVASEGGSLDITVAEGAMLGGELKAGGGNAGSYSGSFSLTLDAGDRKGQAGNLVAEGFPSGVREIFLTRDPPPLVVAPGTAIPSQMNGRAALSTDLLQRAGFDSVALTARTVAVTQGVEGTQVRGGFGQITVDGGVDFSTRARLTLDAAVLATAPGASASLASSYLALGNTDVIGTFGQDTPEVLAPSASVLSLRGDFIDVIGNVAIDGAERVRLESAGDLRLRGIIDSNHARYHGSLTAARDIELDAQQIYPATWTDFVIKSSAIESGTISTSGGGATTPVLAAAGHLTLIAPTIEHAGTLRAPFGTIELAAGDRLALLPGSVTSTAAQTVIPFGTTQGGFDWVYEPSRTIAFGTGDTPVPEQSVKLAGDAIDFQQGATIDASAGGDLQAYEWVKGVGGTVDVLSAAERPNQYAILPSLGAGFAPYDGTAGMQNPTLSPGDSVYLSGAPGLAAGFYTLLPARYALLPGAFLATAVNGYRDITAGESYAQLDGSTVVSGYRTVLGTDIRSSRTQGFAVRPGKDALDQAQYDLSLASEFFARQAQERELPLPRLSNDAGRVSFNAASSLDLAGSLLASVGEHGRGAALDISSSRMRIVNAADAGAADPADGFVTLDAAQLNSLGAESILIGGTRTTATDGTRLDVSATQVEVAGGAELAVPELLLAATDTVRVEDGAGISATGTIAGEDETLLLSGDSALLRVSLGRQVAVRRDGTAAGNTGVLDVGADARLAAAGGSVTIDTSRDTLSIGRLDLAGGSLGIGASRISLGQGTQPVEGLLLDPAQFNALNLGELALNSRSTFDVYGSVQLTASNLVLNAAGIRAGESGADAAITADRITLSNRFGAQAAAEAGDSTLNVTAGELLLDDGDFRLSGFAHAKLEGTQQIVAGNDGTLLAAGDLALIADRIIGNAGVEYSATATGVLNIGSASAATSATALAPLGAKLTFIGDSVTHSGRIDAPSGIVRLAATGAGGDLVVAAGGSVNAAGSASVFDGVTVDAPAGEILLSSASGDVRTEAGSTLDVRTSGRGAGGRVTVQAGNGQMVLEGTLSGAAQAGSVSGEFIADALNLGDLNALNRTLTDGGFFERRSLRQRGAGDLVLASEWRARELDVTADQGGITLAGRIDGAGVSAGRAVLAARDNIVVGGSVDLSASGSGERGGRLELLSTNGGVFVHPGARIDVSSGAQSGPDAPRAGTVHVRASQQVISSLYDDAADNDRLRLAGNISGAGSVTIEGYAAYDRATLGAADVAASDSNPLYTDARDFMAHADDILQKLGHAGDSVYRVVPGIEIDSAAGLSLGTNTHWDLSQWRFGEDVPGVLTLRAAGDLQFNGSLSDGFAGVTGMTPFDQGRESWSYRLIAGADASSSDLMAVLPASDLAAGAGNLVVGAGTVNAKRAIRTGTGRIDIATGGDLTLTNQQSVIYTAGVAGPGVLLNVRNVTGGLGGLPYPIDGGDISVFAQGDVHGAASNQLVTDWLWRTGKTTAGNATATAWTVNFQQFAQGVGALGGGNVNIEAGGDIADLSVSIPSIGRQVGGTTPEENAVDVVGGGNIDVRAGGSVQAGTYYVGLGRAALRAGDTIGTRQKDDGTTSLAPIFALGDGRISALARDGLTVEAVVNPTLLPQGRSQQVTAAFQSAFSTYGADAGVDLLAAAGDLHLASTSDIAWQTQFSSMQFSSSGAVSTADVLRFYPPSLRASALSADLEFVRSAYLFPAAQGNLELFAANDVRLGRANDLNAFTLNVSDANPNLFPSPQAPGSAADLRNMILAFTAFTDPTFHASTPVHAADSTPLRIVARDGSVSMPLGSQAPRLYVPKQARIVAGLDILDLTLVGQNLAATDITSLIAGRDLRYTIARDPVSGRIAASDREITLAGPGQLEIRAGRNVDLQTSKGITTDGATRNPALPGMGAGVSILAGLGDAQPDITAFVDKYFAGGADYDSALIEYIEQRRGVAQISKQDALAEFAALSQSEQMQLVERAFFNELKLSGRHAADPDPTRHDDFSRGFAAIDTLFPGANPDLDAGEANPYAGAIRLYFSKIYTLSGGDVDLIAPGGEINVGLASPPDSFGITKKPEDLGVVIRQDGSANAYAYGDLQVNESRMFSADGGDILVWSTRGDIDAGRGAKTAISAPAPTVVIDANGQVTLKFPPALTGSGIQTLASTEGRKPGNVDLFAPRGVVNASDAGIVAGNLTIAATAVLGADNIQVSGVSVGVPVDTGGLGASLSGVSAAASSSTNAATASMEAGQANEQQASIADSALSWLEVFVVGLGEDNCKQDDVECLKRQKID